MQYYQILSIESVSTVQNLSKILLNKPILSTTNQPGWARNYIRDEIFFAVVHLSLITGSKLIYNKISKDPMSCVDICGEREKPKGFEFVHIRLGPIIRGGFFHKQKRLVPEYRRLAAEEGT